VFSRSMARFTKPLSSTWSTTSSPRNSLRLRLSPGWNGFAARTEVLFSMKLRFPRMAYGIEMVLDIQYFSFSFSFSSSYLNHYPQNPRGFLKSPILIQLGSRFLENSQDTAFDFGPPRGLFVLLLTAVSNRRCVARLIHILRTQISQYEKIARSYKLGHYVHAGDFEAKTCNMWVKQYNKNFDGKTAEWWEKLLTFYGADAIIESDVEGGESILDEQRAALPISSP
jgi:hypothetical protein